MLLDHSLPIMEPKFLVIKVLWLSIVMLLDHSLPIMEPKFLVIKVLWLSCEDTIPAIVRL